MRRPTTAVLLWVLAAGPAAAHMGPPAATPPPEPEKPALRVEKLAENAYCLYGQGGNVGIVVTPAAVLLVDDQFENLAPDIEAEVRKLSKAPIRYVVNTHYHFDHTGGNGHFAKSADLVGHVNVRERMYKMPPVTQATFPARVEELETLLGSGRPIEATYKSVLETKLRLYKTFLGAAKDFKPEEVAAPSIVYDGSLRLYVGGEEVEVFHAATGHTDGDSIVWFPARNVVHMGDLFVHGMYPFIDVDGGGGSEGWLRNLDAVLGKIPEDARVIPGHGEAADVGALKRFRAYMSDLRGAVLAARKAGRPLAEAVREIKLDGYADFKSSWMSLPQNVDQVWQELERKP